MVYAPLSILWPEPERAEAAAELRGALTAVPRLYAIERKRSRSQTSIVLDFYSLDPQQHTLISRSQAIATAYSLEYTGLHHGVILYRPLTVERLIDQIRRDVLEGWPLTVEWL